MTRRADSGRPPALNVTVVGSVVILVGLIAVVLSYNASRGLPFVPTTTLRADVPDAARLVAGSSEVRIGGARIGLVDRVTAVRSPDRPAFARITMKLEPGREALPTDTRVAIRPRSLLGAKYVELVPGRSPRRLSAGATIPLDQAVPVVEISDTFQILAPRPARALQDVITELGDGFAGRGVALNDAINEIDAALPPVRRTLRTLAAPGTRLGAFVGALDRFSRTLADDGASLEGLLDGAARTLHGFADAGPALGQAIGELAATETTAREALPPIDGVLADAAVIAHDLRPAGRRLEAALPAVADGLRDSVPGLRRVPELRAPLQRTLTTVGRVAAAAPSQSAVRKVTAAVDAVSSVLDVLAPAQEHCNVVGLWARNSGEIADEGDANGHWLRFLLMLGNSDQVLQQPEPSPDLHYNPYPREDATECEAGNEPYLPGRRVGNVPGVQDGTERTAPPPQATARARGAGLLAGPEASR